MRRVFAAALACVALSAHAQQIQAPTRVSSYDWACVDASGAVLTPHQRFDTALFACLNNPNGHAIVGGRYRLNRPSAPPPEPPVCPAPPASTTRPQDCPAGSTGTWTQTSTSSVGAPPACAVSTTWSPSSPPAGACNRPPTITGTPTAAVVAGQPYSFVPVAADPDADSLAFTIENRPLWATFNAATGALTGTPTLSNVGIASSIVITVSDGKASASTSAFTITVTAPPPQTPPLTAATLATPTHEAGTNADRYNVNLSWSAVPGATSYRIRRCAGPNCSTMSVLSGAENVPGTTYKNTGIPANTYKYLVDPRRGTSEIGPASNLQVHVVTATPPPPPPPPPPGDGTALLEWTTPTVNVNGTTLADLIGYRVLYGTSATALSRTITLANANLTQYTVPDLTPGTWYFALRTVAGDPRCLPQGADCIVFESSTSNAVSKVVQ